MKKNKLYTANKWNQPAFMEDKNLYSFGDFLNKTTDNIGSIMGGNEIKPVVGGLIGGLGTAVGKIGGNLIGGGLESGAGNAIGNIGGAIGSAISTVNPLVGGIVSVGSGLIGGLTNRMFGTKVDQAKLDAANMGTSAYNNFQSNASSFDDIQGPVAQASVQDAYSGGWFSSGSAARKNEELRKQREAARQLAFRSVDNNLYNLTDDQVNNSLANYSAFGGSIDTEDMGAVNYDFMTDYLTQKRKEASMRNKAAKLSQLPAFMPNSFAIGGDLQTNGADFSDGLVTIGAGGSHESNPNEGVQLGVDNENVPNLVEENETVWNDYVFSNRILADEATKQMFRLPKKKDITFADISKKLEKEIAERPNDPISKAGFEKQMGMLEEQQERQKQEMEAERAKAAFEALSPEEQTALMQQRAQQEVMAQQQAKAEQQAAMQQATPEELAMASQAQMQADGTQAMVGQQAPMMAEGGHLFPWGGLKELFAVKPPYAASRTAGYIPYIQDDKDKYFDENTVKARELEDDFKAWTQYVNDNWDTEEVQSYLRNLDAAAGGNHLFDKDGNIVAGDKAKGILSAKDYFNHARTKDHKWGYYHLTPTFTKELTEVNPDVPIPSGRRSQPATMTTDISGLKPDDSAVRKDVKPIDAKVKSPEQEATKETEDNGESPRHKWGWLRYAGLLGPAVGLGMQALGVGRPDTGAIDAAVQGAGDVSTAKWKPLGNYLTYRPLDIWYQQNALNAQSRATDRQLMNTSGGNRGTAMAGLLANGYNSQLASGNLFRQAQEYNDNLRKQVEEFNRGTDQFNNEQYGITSRFNADARNKARQANAQLRLHAAAQKADMDAGWNQGIYGNVAGLFKGIGDIGRENEQFNWLSDLAADGAFGNLGTSNTSRRWTKDKKAKGGKMKKKGLTI